MESVVANKGLHQQYQNAELSPEEALRLTQPCNGFLCDFHHNVYGIEFLKFDVSDCDTGRVYFSVDSANLIVADVCSDPDELRTIRYNFPESLLRSKYIQTRVEFKVGEQPVQNFRMIEKHFFKGREMRTYQFNFGFVIPSTINNWDSVYDVPQYTEEEIDEIVNASPNEHRADSFYFVNDQLIMHHKSYYTYVKDT